MLLVKVLANGRDKERTEGRIGYDGVERKDRLMRTFMYAQLWHEHSSSCAYFNPLAFGPWFPNCPKSRGILQKAKMFWSKKNKQCFEVISEILITTALINTILFMLSQSSPHNNLYLLLFSVLYMFVLYLFVLCLCFGIGPVSTLVLSLVDYPTVFICSVFHLFWLVWWFIPCCLQSLAL